MATEPLAPLSELEGRLEFELEDDRMIALATNALIDASVLVREYGLQSWTAETAPPIAVTLALKAAARAVNNPSFLETARGADETNMWGEANSNGVHLEPAEIELLREHRKTDRGFQSVPTYVYSSRPAAPYWPSHQIPVAGYGDGTAKWWPDYLPGDEYNPYYPVLPLPYVRR